MIGQAGVDKIDEVWPDHLRSIEKHFGQYISLRDAKSLRSITDKFLDHE